MLTTLTNPYQTTASSRTNGAQSEDQAKEIASLKKQLEEAKSKTRDYGIEIPSSVIYSKLTVI